MQAMQQVIPTSVTPLSMSSSQMALMHLERGVELDQTLPTRYGILHLLLLGDYSKGWEYYEVRFENDDFEHVVIPTSRASAS